MRLAAARSSSSARSTASAATGKQHDGLSHGYPRSPCQRKADCRPRREQIPTPKSQIPRPNICPRAYWDLRAAWDLRVAWDLGRGIWDLGFNKRVGDEPNNEQAGQDVHREVVH